MADTEIKAGADAPQPQAYANGSTSAKRAASASPPRSLSNEEQGEASTSKAAATSGEQGSAASKKEPSDAAADKRRRKAQSKFVNRLRKETARTIEKFGEDPIYHEAVSLLGQEVVEQLLRSGRDLEQKFQRGEELDVEIALLGAHGNGIAVVPGHEWVVSVPKALPGDKVRVRVKQNDRESGAWQLYVEAFLSLFSGSLTHTNPTAQACTPRRRSSATCTRAPSCARWSRSASTSRAAPGVNIRCVAGEALVFHTCRN